MRPEQAFAEAAGLKQRKTQKDRVSHAGPDCPGEVPVRGDTLYQDRINPHADHNQKCLECQGKQGLQVVLAHAAQLPVGEGRHGQRSQTCEQVNFNHAPVDDDENHDVQRPHGHMNEERLEPQPQQSAKAHGSQTCLQRIDHGGRNVR